MKNEKTEENKKPEKFTLADLLAMVIKYNIDIQEKMQKDKLILSDTFYAMIVSTALTELKEENFPYLPLNSIKNSKELEKIIYEVFEFLNEQGIFPLQQIEILLQVAMMTMLLNKEVISLTKSVRYRIEQNEFT
ncbi:MAG: hypothetical protein QW745_07050 [Thermoplasmata archaeon]